MLCELFEFSFYSNINKYDFVAQEMNCFLTLTQLTNQISSTLLHDSFAT